MNADDTQILDGRARSARGSHREGRGRPLLGQPVVRVGPVSERARLGHRARGLLGGRQRLGQLPARPRTLARVSLERGRHGRHLRHPARALSCARALEREGRHPQGAHVRADRPAGQPRRGCQGVLVVSRGAAEPRIAALALPLPAGRVPLRAARPPRPRPARSGAGAARHRRVRRGSLLVGGRDLCQGVTDRGAGAHRGREPRPRRGDPRRTANAVVPEHLGMERRNRPAADRARRRGPGRRGSRTGGLPARGRTGARRRGSRDALLRERDQCAAHLRVGGDHAVPEGWDQRPRHQPERRPSTRPGTGRRRRCTTGSPCPQVAGQRCDCDFTARLPRARRATRDWSATPSTRS